MINLRKSQSGNNSVVECNLAKVEVAGSNPVSRSKSLRRTRRIARGTLSVRPSGSVFFQTCATLFLMDWNAFKDLPDEARIWIHGFGKLSGEGRETIRQELEGFLPGWDSHGARVKGAYTILFERFVVTAGYSSQGISGCSTDSLIRNFKMLRTAYGLDGLKGGLLYYRDSVGKIQEATPQEFRRAVEEGTIGSGTSVFQTLLGSLGELRAGKFEVPFEESTLAGVFALPTAR